MPLNRLAFLLCCLVLCLASFGQKTKPTLPNDNLLSATKDSLKNMELADSNAAKRKHIPRIATRRSLILPGWGQAYNHQYWKIPIVYAALAIPAYTFFYNNSYYKKTKFAYEALYKASYGTPKDSSDLDKIDPQLKQLNIYSLQTYRNAFRRDRDYSILWFVILWGLNVADATVFGHLKNFDVSNDLSLHVQPSFNPINKLSSLSLVLNTKKQTHKMSQLSQ